MICSRRLYKGNSYEICLPLVDTGITSVKFYTRGDVIIEKEPVYTGDGMCFELSVEDLAILADGVLRYTCDGYDSNTGFVTVTPGDYSGETLDDMLEDAYDSGYTAGQEDCSGGTCEGVYESGYTGGYESGYTDGAESVDCTDYYNSGYTSGRTDGEEAGFDEGYQSGETHQKSLLSSISISVNGSYSAENGYSAVTVDVPTPSVFYNGRLSVTTANTEIAHQSDNVWNLISNPRTLRVYPPEGFDAMEQADISVIVPLAGLYNSGYTSGLTDGWQPGYNSGYTDGMNAGSGDYASGYTDGFNHGYVSGLTDGLVSGRTDGYNSGVTVGVTVGEEIQKAKLVATSFTANDTYTRADGWSYVTVNVAQTGYTQQDLENAFASGFSAGYDSGLTDCSGSTPVTATSISASAPSGLVPGNTGNVTVTATPNDATTNLLFLSSDNSVATVDTAGTITAVGVGTCDIYVIDSISNLTASTQVTVSQPLTGADVTLTVRADQNLSPVKLCNQTNIYHGYVSAMTIDGAPVSPVSSWTFSDTNVHTVGFWYIGPTIPDSAYTNSPNIETVAISDRLTDIGLCVFRDCTSMTSVIISSSITAIKTSAFTNCTSLQTVVIPDSVVYIQGGVFKGCTSLTSVTIGAGVTTIETSAFENCTALTGVTIPVTVTDIYSAAFKGCTSLNIGGITLVNTVPPSIVAFDVFQNTNDAPIYVPAESVETYKSASYWSYYANRIQAIQ